MATAPNPEEQERERSRRKEPDPRIPERRQRDPGIVNERTIVGPHGEEEHEVVDEYGRRFWSFRLPRQRYDVWGFGLFS